MTAKKRTRARETAAGHLHGDPGREQLVARMIRVDHAGEYGAVRIYEGQLAVLGDGPAGPAIAEMADKEREHLETFNRLITERRVRPTLLTPLWHLTGFALGAGTALLGERAAMACTVAVEDVIMEHYEDQAARLGDDEKDLRQTVEEFRKDEEGHRLAALEHEADLAPAYPLLTAAIRTGSRMAIWLSERV